MFRKNNQFYGDPLIQKLSYQFEDIDRKMKNLNNRVRRIENYLGLRMEDKFDEDIYNDDIY